MPHTAQQKVGNYRPTVVWLISMKNTMTGMPALLAYCAKLLCFPIQKFHDFECAGVPWRDMAEDGSVDDGRDNFYYVLNNVIEGNHLPCPLTVDPILPELPQVNLGVKLLQACACSERCS